MNTLLADKKLPDRRRIAVATVTRNRPKMLRQLLESYSRLELPENCQVEYILVENNSSKSLTDIVEGFSRLIPRQNVIYLIEPELGIASARNRALKYAMENGFDLLTFADDDEVVERSWLVELLFERDYCNLDLVGSPVRIGPIDSSYSWWNRMVWDSVNDNNRRSEARASRKQAEGRAGTLKIATGSWMGELNFFRQTGLVFNVALGLAGGEDWRLYDEAKALGAKTGWAPRAIAYETLPASRLLLRYYYRRARDHACMVYMERFRRRPLASLVRLFGSLCVRLYKTVIAIGILPFQPRNSILACVYHIGSSVGFIRGCLGLKSFHYFETDGH